MSGLMTLDRLFALMPMPIAIWLLLVFLLLTRLRSKHPATFQALGAPSLLRPAPQLLTEGARLLFTSKHQALNDKVLSMMIFVMRIVFIVSLAALSAVFVVVLGEFGNRPAKR